MSDINLALTTAGQALMAKIALGNGTLPLEITRIVTSSIASPGPLNSTALVKEEQEFIITGKQTVGARSTIRTRLNNFGNPLATPPIPSITEGYSIEQIGFYALDPDVGEILMRISQFDNPNYVPAVSERAWEFEAAFNFITGNASTVIIQIDPSSGVNKSDIWDSVNISNTPSMEISSVRTHYRETDDATGYISYQPDNGLILQGYFDATTGLDENNNPLPMPDITNNNFYWIANTAGAFTPPGEITPLSFTVNDWIVSDGSTYTQSAPQISPDTGLFNGAKISEIRIISDPSSVSGSPYKVALPVTVLSAVIDLSTQQTLDTILSNILDILSLHTNNTNIHVTAGQMSIIFTSLGELVSHIENTDIHVTAADKLKWNNGVDTADLALLRVNDLNNRMYDTEIRLDRIEDSLYSNITGNPFTVIFNDLTGISIVKGIWNRELQRIEC